MAPACADPRQIVIVLNPDRRQLLLKIIEEIILHMIENVQSIYGQFGPVVTEQDLYDENGNIIPPEPEDDKTAAKSKRKAQHKASRILYKAVKHMEKWSDSFVPEIQQILDVKDDDSIIEQREKRRDAADKKESEDYYKLVGLKKNNDGQTKIEEPPRPDLPSDLCMYYPAIYTRLRALPLQDRKEILSCIILVILSTARYSAYSRIFCLHLACALRLPHSFLVQEEIEIATNLIKSINNKAALNAEAEAAKRAQENKTSRYLKVGLASLAGAAVIGITGGLAAPLVAGTIGGILGGIGLGGVASFLGVFWMNSALVGALFGAFGAKMTGEIMDAYAKEVQDFKFIALNENQDLPKRREAGAHQWDESHRLRVTIGINGWLDSEEDIVRPWRVLPDDTEVFALRYEMDTLLSLGTALQRLAKNAAWKLFRLEIIKRTVLATLFAALWPITLISAAASIDTPFYRVRNRSQKAGELLADALANNVQGKRPVTLIGYSNGATAIHSCLKSLAERGAFGLIDNVVMIGAPAPADSAHWQTISLAVAGKIFNVYSENDMILGFVHRMHTLSLGVAGLQPIKHIYHIENVDLSERVSGHLRYPDLIGEILRKCGFHGIPDGEKIERDELMNIKHEHAKAKAEAAEAAAAPTRPLQERLSSESKPITIRDDAHPENVRRSQTEPHRSVTPTPHVSVPSRWHTGERYVRQRLEAERMWAARHPSVGNDNGNDDNNADDSDWSQGMISLDLDDRDDDFLVHQNFRIW